jgi:peptidoglycan/LPS O-acetylase OafA/YrhL
LLALNAFGGGIYGIMGAREVPIEWLEGSPFKSYFIPGLILIICVGGSAWIAAMAVFKRRSHARLAALACGMITLIWIATQVAIIGYVSWLQPTIAAMAMVILVLGWLFPKN